MLLEYISPDLNTQLLFGLALGLVFGVAAQISRFCLRRSIAGEDGADLAGLSVWLVALGVAIVALQAAVASGYAVLEGHRWLATDVPVAAIVIGGLAFGVGMVLTRGCATRLTVLSATGNLRALTVMVIFAIVAHATLKGVLSPIRVWLTEPSMTLPIGSLASIPGAVIVLPALTLLSAALLARKTGASALHLTLGAIIGLLAAIGWIGTSTLFMDDFDPTPVQSLAATLPWTETLFWTLASTAVPAGFGPGLIGGLLIGAFLSAAARSELQLVSFGSPAETLRYSAGAVLMGIGGVLAGGCTIGAGLSGVATLGVSAIIALGAIVVGALAARHLQALGSGVPASA